MTIPTIVILSFFAFLLLVYLFATLLGFWVARMMKKPPATNNEPPKIAYDAICPICNNPGIEIRGGGIWDGVDKNNQPVSGVYVSGNCIHCNSILEKHDGAELWQQAIFTQLNGDNNNDDCL